MAEPLAWVAPELRLGIWDPNWDRPEPRSLINWQKRSLQSGELVSRPDHHEAKATRPVFLTRLSQFHLHTSLEKDCTLIPV